MDWSESMGSHVSASLSNEKNTPARKMVWAILTRSERRGLLLMLLLMLIGSALETLSLGLVVPVVGFLTRPNYLNNFPTINDLLGHPSEIVFIVGTMSFLVVVYIVKSGFLVWATWVQRKYSLSVTNRIGTKLYLNYLRQPYSYFLQTNSAILIRNSQNSALIMSGIVDPVLVISSDIFVTLGLFTLLVILQPIGTLATVSVFGFTAVLFRKFTNSRIKIWGQAQNFHKGMILQHLQQGFGGIKDVKILGAESHFVSQYQSDLEGKSRVDLRFAIAQALPRFGLEILTIVGLAILVSTMVVLGTELTAILPVVGLFGAASFRLLPAINRLINNAQLIGLSRPQVIDLFRDLALPQVEISDRQNRRCFQSEISICNVSFAYEASATEALAGISLQISRGEAIGLIGESGSGKSTLIDILLGLLKPTSGEVIVDGQDINADLRGWQDQIGYVPQSIFLTDDTLRRNVAFGLPKEKIDNDAVELAIRSAQLEDFVATLPDGIDTFVGERGIRLSGGQRQRIGIARALYNNPDVLVLDEATSSLDTETEHGVMEAVQALQGTKTVIIVAHRVSTVEYCDRHFRIENSRIVDEGTYSEVISRVPRYTN